MMNKRDFLKGGAGAAVAAAAAAGAPAALAAVRPSLGGPAGLASWQAHVGQRFQVNGHAVTLQAVRPITSRQPGEQFSLDFQGSLPQDIGDGLYLLGGQPGEPMALYLARTAQGLRADFCRLQG